MEYNFSKLWITQFWGFYQFKTFFEFASDKESQINYYKRLKALHFDENGKKEIETPESVIEYMTKEIDGALNMIKNQFLVFIFTRYESVIQETVNCLMCDDSERMLKFLKVYPNYKDTLGFSLVEFVKYETKEDYIKIMSARLGSQMLSGRPTKVVKRLKCLLDIDDINVTVLDELMDKRNNIVHEGQVYQIEISELERYYETLDDLLKKIAMALKNINISVIDSGQILNEE